MTIPKEYRKPKETIIKSEQEVIVHLPLTDLHPFPDHPYGIREDQASRRRGVLFPEGEGQAQA